MRPQPEWHGVELRHLAALQAVGHESSFSAAAAALGYTQSAISGQISALERLVGTRLVERIRGSRFVQLTEEGEVLAAHAAAIAARLDTAHADLARMRAGAGPALRIGTFHTVSRVLIADALRRLSADDCDAELSLRESHDSGALLDQVERGTLDVALVQLPVREGPFVTTELYRDEYVLLVRRTDPLASRPSVALEEVAAGRLITLGPGRPRGVVMHVDDAGSLVALVAAGLGVGHVPALSVVLPNELTAVELEPGAPPHVIGLVWHRDRVPTVRVQRFAELAATAASRDLGRPLLRAL